MRTETLKDTLRTLWLAQNYYSAAAVSGAHKHNMHRACRELAHVMESVWLLQYQLEHTDSTYIGNVDAALEARYLLFKYVLLVNDSLNDSLDCATIN